MVKRLGKKHSQYQQALGQRLRAARRAHGWSLMEAERESYGQWTAATLGSYERGDRIPSAVALALLARFYCVRTADLLPDDGVLADRRQDS